MNRSADLEALTRPLLPGYRAPGVGCEGLETCACEGVADRPPPRPIGEWLYALHPWRAYSFSHIMGGLWHC